MESDRTGRGQIKMVIGEEHIRGRERFKLLRIIMIKGVKIKLCDGPSGGVMYRRSGE